MASAKSKSGDVRRASTKKASAAKARKERKEPTVRANTNTTKLVPEHNDDPLFRRVLENPTDAALRQVWADSLIERGDPRGEMIAIQVAAETAAQSATGRSGDRHLDWQESLTPAQDKRIRSLIAQHRVEWLGPLASVAQHREGLIFDRGVLDACQIQVKNLDGLRRAIGHPYWSTVRSMWFCDGYAWDPRIVPLLCHPVLRSLQSVACIGVSAVFPSLVMHAQPLPIESIWTIDDDFRVGRDAILALGEAKPGLPNLRHLGFTQPYGELGWIFELPLLRSKSSTIETLGISNTDKTANTMRVFAEPLKNVKTLELRPHWLPMHANRPSILRFHRGRDGRFSRLLIDAGPAGQLEWFQQDIDSIAPDALEHIEVRSEKHVSPLRRRFANAEVVFRSASSPDLSPTEREEQVRWIPRRR